MGVKRQADRPVETPPGMARVLDVAEEVVDVTSTPIWSRATRWTASVTGSANRTVPPGSSTGRRTAADPTGQQHAEFREHGESGHLLEDRLLRGLRERYGRITVRPMTTGSVRGRLPRKGFDILQSE